MTEQINQEKSNDNTTAEKNFEYFEKIYQKIERFLETEQSASDSQLDFIRLQGYWKIGKLLETEDKKLSRTKFKDLQNYLQQKLKFKKRKLLRIQQLYRYWPKKAPAQKAQDALNWGKYCEILTVANAPARKFYLKEAIASNWSCDQLRRAIQHDLYSNKNTLQRYTQGKLKRFNSMINTFWAQIARVIDGDTVVARIDLRFGTTTLEELRLRGINCYELNDPNGLGLKAKDFVEAELKDCPWVLIVSYKTDKFGRYVADIYYSSVYESEEDLLEKGQFLNQRLLNVGLAKRVEY